MSRVSLIPLSWLYKWGVMFRHRLFDWGIIKTYRFDVPVVCVGNITVGGTGKTPMAEMVIAHASQTRKVALISLGYGRRTKGYLEVTVDAHYRDVGDEPLQIKRKFPDTVVVVCEKRVEGIKRILRDYPEVDLVVMDDGFQHRQVEATVNIVMIDATRPVQEDRMLPAGNLRDTINQLHRAHYFVVTKCPESMTPLDCRITRKVLVTVAYQRVYFTRYETFKPRPLFPTEVELEYGQPVIAMSGIGNSGPFIEGVKRHFDVVESLSFEDHHVYRVKDMKTVEELLKKHPDAAVVMTEKDAVKLVNSDKIPASLRAKLYYEPIDITFIDDSQTDFFQRLDRDVRAN